MNYKRVVVGQLGGPEVLQVIEEELPEPQPGAVRVRVLAAGVSYADLLTREGVHPETPRLPFTPGWDLVGVVDKLGDGVSTLQLGELVASLPVVGGYAEFVCLPEWEVGPVPSGLDPAEAVSLVLNYVTAYQMLHRSAQARQGERALIHSAAGGVGSALLQLGKLEKLEMYGTASSAKHDLVSSLGGTPIDYRKQDFVKQIQELTGDGVDVVFDGIGGKHLWRSYKSLRGGGRVISYGLTSTLNGGTLSGGRRHRLRGLAIFAAYIAAAALIPDGKRMVLYSIQTLERQRPAWFREDLTALLQLLAGEKITPIVAEQFPLAQAARAHELLGKGSVMGKIVLLCDT